MENWLLGALAVTGLFVLRIGVPLAVIVLIVYAIRHWEMHRWSAALRRWETHPTQAGAPALTLLHMLTQPCPAEKSHNGSGKASRHVPCWVMRRQAEGGVPSSCLHCERYLQTQALESLV